MPAATSKVEDPCQACRDRHLKCDNETPRCQQCERLGKICERANGRHKFRFGSSAKYDHTFAKDQVWLGHARGGKLQFVDQGPELEIYHSTDTDELHDPKACASDVANTIGASTRASVPPSTNINHTTRASIEVRSDSADLQDTNTPAPLSSKSTSDMATGIRTARKRRRQDKEYEADQPQSQRPRAAENEPSRFYAVNKVRQSSTRLGRRLAAHHGDQQAELKKVYAEYERLEDEEAAWVPPDELLSPDVWKRYFFWPNEKTTTQCACLMRYYTDRIGPWFDIGDPNRHFTLLVPQRARRCPPLLNAIFTVAARHLTHLAQHRDTKGAVRYHGNVMPKLDKGFAIKYQNASIAYLRELCKHPDYVQDEDLLAATVILRHYDEFEATLDGARDGTVFRSMQLFVASHSSQSSLVQPPYGLGDFRKPGTFAAIRDEIELSLKTYPHASLRIALRQECSRAFMKQRPIGLDFSSWSVLQGFDEAEDFVWADRHLYHFASVLQFCFDESLQGQKAFAQWQELKSFETRWEEHKPMSFAAIHYRTPNVAAGEPLPELWYLADIHAAATQYFHLSRILLTVYDPTIPRLGPRATSALKKVDREVRRLVLEVCGIAASMPGCEPALLQASMAIALCGEHFTDPIEQKALLKLLQQLEVDHGYSMGTTVQSLKQSWS